MRKLGDRSGTKKPTKFFASTLALALLTQVLDATMVEMATVKVPKEYNLVTLTGRGAPGDVGTARFKREWSEPSHPGKFRAADRYLPDGTISANGGWFGLAERVVRPEMLGNVETSFAAAFRDALLTAHAINAEKVALQRRRYVLHEGVAVAAINVFIDGNLARIERSATSGNYIGLDIVGGFENLRAVVAVSNQDFTYGTATSKVARIELANEAAAATYAVNDVVKIVADDLIPSSPVEDSERVGETHRIGAIDGKYLYLFKLLAEKYTTNIRIARVISTKTSLARFSMGDEVGSPDTRRSPVLRTVALVDLVARDVEVADALTIGWQRMSCHAPRSFHVQARKLRTVPSSPGDGGTFAYGIMAVGECDGVDNNPYAEKVRHCYTTGALTCALNDPDLTRYGGVIRGTVNNGYAVDCEHAAWDTHADALEVTFNACRQGLGHRGPAGSYRSHQLRGRGCKIIAGQSSAPCSVGVYMRGNDGDHYIEIDHERPAGVGTTIEMLTIDGSASPTPGRVTLKARIKCNDGASPLIKCNNVEFTPESRITVDHRYTAIAPHVMNLTKTTLRGEMIVDYSRTLEADVSTSVRIFEFADGNNDVALDALSIKTDSDTRPIYFVNFVGFDGRAVFPNVDIDKGILTGISGFLDPGANAKFWARETYSKGTRAGRAFFSVAYTTAGEQALTWSPRGDPMLVARVRADVAGVVINQLSPGAYDGQMITIINNNTPVQSLDVKHNPNAPGLISIGAGSATKSLINYAAMTLIWSVSANVWRPVSSYAP